MLQALFTASYSTVPTALLANGNVPFREALRHASVRGIPASSTGIPKYKVFSTVEVMVGHSGCFPFSPGHSRSAAQAVTSIFCLACTKAAFFSHWQLSSLCVFCPSHLAFISSFSFSHFLLSIFIFSPSAKVQAWGVCHWIPFLVCQSFILATVSHFSHPISLMPQFLHGYI